MGRTPGEKETGKWLRLLRFKSFWKDYMKGHLSYIEFREGVFIKVNAIRRIKGVEPLTQEKFDKGWQHRTVGNENYKVAYNEMLTLVSGGW